MELENDVLEDGEISDDSTGCYKPLQRPLNYSKFVPNPRLQIIDPESDDQSISQSSSDSDSEHKSSKRPKLKPIRRAAENKTKKKFDIWSNRAQDDLLSETLTSCDVSNRDRSRAVESYDYSLGKKFYEQERTCNKRTHCDRENSSLKLFKKKDAFCGKNKTKGTSRTIFDLNTSTESTVEEIVKDLANKLYEEKEDLIENVVKIAGKEKTFEIFRETKKIEEEGGMLIMNQTRRRTPGGVFFFLVKHDSELNEEQQSKIFEDDKMKCKYVQKKLRNAQSERFKSKSGYHKKEPKNTSPEQDFPTRSDIVLEKTSKSRRESDETYVTNPPPSPATDLHETNIDDMSTMRNIEKVTAEINRRLINYEDECLVINHENMDFF